MRVVGRMSEGCWSHRRIFAALSIAVMAAGVPAHAAFQDRVRLCEGRDPSDANGL